jgi:hypothetical protein
MNAAITSVYTVIALWMPVTVVPTSFATVAMETFMTDVSSVIKNCADANVSSTIPVPVVEGEASARMAILRTLRGTESQAAIHPPGVTRSHSLTPVFAAR